MCFETPKQLGEWEDHVVVVAVAVVVVVVVIVVVDDDDVWGRMLCAYKRSGVKRMSRATGDDLGGPRRPSGN